MKYFINPQERIVETWTGGGDDRPGYTEVTRLEYETMYLVWTIGIEEINRIAQKFAPTPETAPAPVFHAGDAGYSDGPETEQVDDNGDLFY